MRERAVCMGPKRVNLPKRVTPVHCCCFVNSQQVRQIGCKIKFIAGDGNCLFRSLADQLEGRPEDHASVRAKVKQHCSTRCNEVYTSQVSHPTHNYHTYYHTPM